MSAVLWLLVIVMLGAMGLVGGLALAVRSTISNPLSLSVTAVPGAAPCINLSLRLRPGCRRLVVNGLSVSRQAVELLGMAAPAGFDATPFVAPGREAFEADLEEFADRRDDPTPDEIESETARQFAEYAEMSERAHRETVSYSGRLVITLGEEKRLDFPVSRAAAAAGRITVLFHRRVGLWSSSSGQSVAFSTAFDRIGSEGVR